MASYLTRQSERDVVQRYTVQFDWTDNARTNAMEVLGNHVIHLVTLYSSDVCLLTKPIFEKYNKKHNIRGAGPYIDGCRRATEGMLSYMKWIHDSNAAGEVMKCGPRTAEMLQDVQTCYPHRERIDKWHIPKMVGS